MTTSKQQPSISISPLAFWVLAAAVLGIRLSLTRFPHNFDYDSYNIVADLASNGKNVYANTNRYNYSPIWMWILLVLKKASLGHFRLLLSGFVSCVDISIAAWFYKRGKHLASLFILLSPICITISGFHHQFDNLAILISLLAFGWAERQEGFKQHGLTALSTGQFLMFTFLIGLALTTKHILFFFPLWVLFQRGLPIMRKMVFLTLPYVVFLASFLPYSDAWKDITANVFHYSPHLNAPFYALVFPKPLWDTVSFFGPDAFRYLFYLLIIGAGYVVRKRPLLEQMMLYYLFIVLFSCSLYTHYMVIPMVFLAYFGSRYWYWYNGFGLLFFIFHHDQFNLVSHVGPGFQPVADFIEMYGYYPLMACLILAVVEIYRREGHRHGGLKWLLKNGI